VLSVIAGTWDSASQHVRFKRAFSSTVGGRLGSIESNGRAYRFFAAVGYALAFRSHQKRETRVYEHFAGWDDLEKSATIDFEKTASARPLGKQLH